MANKPIVELAHSHKTSYLIGMNIFNFWKRKTVDDLQTSHHFNYRSLRQRIKILIIDDVEFQYLETIRRHGYNPTYVKDIDDIALVESYDVILCDIKGVGKQFGSKYEGAHIIMEIHKSYPFKIIIGYTGHQFDAEYNKFFSICDVMVKKDVDSDNWIEKLDDAIQKSTDPIYQWQKLHMLLCKKRTSAKLIAKIEDNFVRSLENGRIKFPNSAVSLEVNDDVKNILNNLAASSIFNIIASTL